MRASVDEVDETTKQEEAEEILVLAKIRIAKRKDKLLLKGEKEKDTLRFPAVAPW